MIRYIICSSKFSSTKNNLTKHERLIIFGTKWSTASIKSAEVLKSGPDIKSFENDELTTEEQTLCNEKTTE